MLEPSSVPKLAAVVSALTLFLFAQPSMAGKGVSQRVTTLEKQVAALSLQTATLQEKIASWFR